MSKGRWVIWNHPKASQYIEVDGVLYGQEGGRGSDITRGGETLQVLWEGESPWPRGGPPRRKPPPGAPGFFRYTSQPSQ